MYNDVEWEKKNMEGFQTPTWKFSNNFNQLFEGRQCFDNRPSQVSKIIKYKTYVFSLTWPFRNKDNKKNPQNNSTLNSTYFLCRRTITNAQGLSIEYSFYTDISPS